MKSSLRERSTHRWGAVLGMAAACALGIVACTTSEEDDGASGAAGDSAMGQAGTTGGGAGTGAAGTTANGAAGTSSSGAAGTRGVVSGSAGVNGSAGVTGKAGNGGAAGSSGSGTGAAGTKGAAGTTGAAGTGAAMVYTFTTGIGNMLDLACGGCHLENTSVPIKGNFGTSYAKVMASVTSDHMNCPNLDATKKRIVPGKPENSMIYIKVAVPNIPSSCGGHMPANGVSMGASQIQALKDWILAGAPM